MTARRFDLCLVSLARSLDRRGVLLALTAGVSAAVAGGLPGPAPARRGRRKKERKRLRKQCKRQCKRVQRDCLFVCRNLGNPDDVCHPRCATARRGCRRGC
jgi:hypothetical protein